MKDKRIKCTIIGVYEHALTRGKIYEVSDEDEDKFRIVGDHGKKSGSLSITFHPSKKRY